MSKNGGSMGLTVGLESGQVDQLALNIVDRVVENLEERVSQMVTERLETILDGKYLVVPQQLTYKQVAHILQIPLPRARAMMSSGDIPRVKYDLDADGGSVRVDPRDLALWLEAHQEFPARRDELRQIVEEGLMLHA